MSGVWLHTESPEGTEKQDRDVATLAFYWRELLSHLVLFLPLLGRS